ncbi:hypothetical protein TEA_015760 [Camellia sinensis var. sinensis]|uniref:Chloride channel protein n=1 Tax=Camellia sinensis var. sinensis TaxID=542762 RepID=A0A4S4E9Q4_CAMSN|nr:hypothetical protein TEA_015760 [Camellia sinensis var. sinensis]
MGVLTTCGCQRVLQLPSSPLYYCRLVPLIVASCCNKSSLCFSFGHYYSSSSIYRSFFPIPSSSKLGNCGFHRKISKSRRRGRVGLPGDLPEAKQQSETVLHNDEEDDSGKQQQQPQPQQQEGGKSEFGNDNQPRVATVIVGEAFSLGNSAIISACFVGLLTGISVVVFNNAVHELRDFFWGEIPYRGASWLREEPVEAALEPILKTLAACITLGTGNSLGPEGPSVEIGASIAKGVGTLFDRSAQRKLSLVAAGSAAGISSGFNAAVAGCFFAVESVLWPSPAESSSSLTNATSMVILSAVIASVVSEIGLGSEPAFTVPEYDFRSPSELPLYLLLGVLCGLVSLILSRCTSFMLVTIDNVHKVSGIPKGIFPILGGLAVGLIALAYPEILYWGFENVDILLESRPSVKGLSADLLFQLVAVKIVATSVCRASGLVGGYYAPSLFIGAATGMAYGKFVSSTISLSDPIFHLSFLEVASPQAYGLGKGAVMDVGGWYDNIVERTSFAGSYLFGVCNIEALGLVGMAATLAGVCQVPLTAVLLLFELTQDYRIVLPLLGAVGLSSWITSGHTSRTERDTKKLEEGNAYPTIQPKMSSCNLNELSAKPSYANNLCKIESSLCVDDSNDATEELERRILVSQAMRTRYVTVLLSTLLTEAVNLMLEEKQSCAIIVDDDNLLVGLLTIRDIQEFSKSSKARRRRPEELLVSEVCSLNGEKCRVLWTITPVFDWPLTQSNLDVPRLDWVKEKEKVERKLKDTVSIKCANGMRKLGFQVKV